MKITQKQLKDACRGLGLTVGGTKEDLEWRLIEWMKVADLEVVRQSIEASPVLEYVRHRAYRPTPLARIVELAGTGVVKVPTHSGHCTDMIEEINEPNRMVIGGVMAKDADHCVKTWYSQRRENVKLDHVYHVAVGWLLKSTAAATA